MVGKIQRMTLRSSVATGLAPRRRADKPARGATVGLMALALLTSACGQKGPLTLPTAPSATTAASAPAR
jgi:predicted small lipoprotein YifL